MNRSNTIAATDPGFQGKRPVYHTPPLEQPLYDQPPFGIDWFFAGISLFLVLSLGLIWLPLGIGLGTLLLLGVVWAYVDHILSLHRFGQAVFKLTPRDDHSWEVQILHEGRRDHLADSELAIRVRRRYTEIIDGDRTTSYEELVLLKHHLLDLVQPSAKQHCLIVHLPTPVTNIPDSGTELDDGVIVWDLLFIHHLRAWTDLVVTVPLTVKRRTKLKFAPPSKEPNKRWWQDLLWKS